jgi:hypothetical protein
VYLRVAHKSWSDKDQWVPIKYRIKTKIKTGRIVTTEWGQLLAPGLVQVANTVIGGWHGQNIPMVIKMFAPGVIDARIDDDNEEMEGSVTEDSASKIVDLMEHRIRKDEENETPTIKRGDQGD